MCFLVFYVACFATDAFHKAGFCNISIGSCRSGQLPVCYVFVESTRFFLVNDRLFDQSRHDASHQ